MSLSRSRPVEPDPAAAASLEGPRSKRTSKRVSRTRDKIVHAATDLFARRGFNGVSLHDIAELAEVRRSLILYYFESKEHLWKTAASSLIERFNTEMSARLDKIAHLDEAEFRHRNMEIWLSGYLDMPEVAQFLVREGGEASTRLDWLVEEVGVPALNLQLLDRFREAPPFDRTAINALTIAIVALAPLFEAKMRAITGESAGGFDPLSAGSRGHLIEIMEAMRTRGAEPAPRPVHSSATFKS